MRIKGRTENRPGKLIFLTGSAFGTVAKLFFLVRETHSQVAIGLVKKCKNGNMLQLA